MSTAINLSALSTPDVVEELDFETLLDQEKAALLAEYPEYAEALALESEPLTILIQRMVYAALNLRGRVNDAARAVMLATAVGADLDHLAALLNVQRQPLDPGDAAANPPIPATWESDARLRERCQLAWEGLSTAGPRGGYVYHALSASPEVLDASATSPNPGEVVVSVLATDGDGTPDAALLAAVDDAVNADEVRPLTDQVSVVAAEIIPYSVVAELTLFSGPDNTVVRAAAESAVQAYVSEHHRLGHDITISGLHQALHQPGVQRVALTAPAAEISVTDRQAAWCDGVAITVGGQGV